MYSTQFNIFSLEVQDSLSGASYIEEYEGWEDVREAAQAACAEEPESSVYVFTDEDTETDRIYFSPDGLGSFGRADWNL